MNLRNFLICIATMFSMANIFSSCADNEDNPGPSFATDDVVIGYWRLEHILKNDVQIANNQYPSTLTTSQFQDLYFSFNSNNEFVYTLEFENSVAFWNGDWELTKDTLRTNYVNGGGVTEYKLGTYSENEISIADVYLPEYYIVFKRIPQVEYPETLMTALVNNQSFVAQGNVAYDEGGFYHLTGGNTNNDIISIIANNPDDLVAGQKLTTIAPAFSITYAPKGDFSNSYKILVGGEVSILKRSATYIHFTFSFTLENSAGAQVIISDGNFKAIIKKPN